MPKKAKLFLKFFFLITPIIWIFSSIDYSILGNTLRKTPLWLPFFFLGLTIANLSLTSFRWWLLIKIKVPKVTFKEVFYYNSLSMYYSLALPTSAGQDIARSFLLADKYGHDNVWATTIIGRVLGLTTLIAYSIIGISTLQHPFFDKYHNIIFIWSPLLILTIMLSLFSKSTTRPIRNILNPILPEKIFQYLSDIRNVLYNYRSNKRTLLLSFLITLSVQGIIIFSYCGLFGALMNNWYFAEAFAFVPTIETVCQLLAITPNGSGVREFMFSGMFKFLSLSKEQLAAFSTITLAIPIYKSIGGLPLLWKYIKK